MAALLLFFFSVRNNIEQIIENEGLISTKVLPGWSSYIGCGAVGCYLLTTLWLMIVGLIVCVSRSPSERQCAEDYRYYEPFGTD